eukprot:CAMPEP_0204863258 /NCGR_PEP_ID=MMETSP1348-20121228/3184_1 /ASSEMBLY_ACC=CAM_ASM_000700 /TAXON_ID=215587 /ORGANISM="Aplanochytrium stocchinoi, Strain GSBS06" /LENGTH=489 /DNA_ID=CAMNT_0052013545 /DNA_START=109 /DNA_END=1578 /DNA_ORIENTATION=-
MVSESGVQMAHNDAPNVSCEDYVYSLPEELIAAYPAEPRGSSRLLVRVTGADFESQSQDTDRKRVMQLENAVKKVLETKNVVNVKGTIFDQQFCDLCDLLPPNAHLIMNQSKVFPARMYAKDTSESEEDRIEVMFLDLEKNSPNNPSNYTSEALQKDCNMQEWRVMIRKEKIRVGDKPLEAISVSKDNTEFNLNLEIIHIHSDWIEDEGNGVEATVRIVLNTSEKLSMAQAFEHFGTVPLPPYLGRESEASDRGKYQTVYAKDSASGSVAAPTAGLHFTDELLAKIHDKGVKRSFVNLHVGAGTFRPVTVDNIASHKMHEEQFSVGANTIKEIIHSLKNGNPLVPVGTTSVRVLESIYWFGCLAMHNKLLTTKKALFLGQWDAYALSKAFKRLPSAEQALSALLGTDDDEGISGSTCICIAPGYKFRLCDGLVTNFHQPHSTLMLLVGALLDSPENCKEMYTHAVASKYRFLSYGDASFILNAQGSSLS